MLLENTSIRAARLGHAIQNGRAENSFIGIFEPLREAIRSILVSHPRRARAVHFETACGISSSVQHPAMIDVSVRHAGEEILFNMDAVAASCARTLRYSNAQFSFDKNFNPTIMSRFLN